MNDVAYPLQSSMGAQASSRSGTRRRYFFLPRAYPPYGYIGADGSYDQNFPEHQFPSIIGRPILRSEESSTAGDIKIKDIMCGDEAATARSQLQITYPVRWSESPSCQLAACKDNE